MYFWPQYWIHDGKSFPLNGMSYAIVIGTNILSLLCAYALSPLFLDKHFVLFHMQNITFKSCRGRTVLPPPCLTEIDDGQLFVPPPYLFVHTFICTPIDENSLSQNCDKSYHWECRKIRPTQIGDRGQNKNEWTIQLLYCHLSYCKHTLAPVAKTIVQSIYHFKFPGFQHVTSL